MMIHPLHDHVALRRIKPEPTTPGGLYLAIADAQVKYIEAVVLAVGDGRVLDTGKVHPLAVKVGDRVLVNKHTGFVEVTVDGEEVLLYHESSILAVVEETASNSETQLRRALAEAANWIDSGADAIDDDIDGECTNAHAFAKHLRELAGVPPQRPGLMLWRCCDWIAVAGTPREAADIYKTNGLFAPHGIHKVLGMSLEHTGDIELVREGSLTLTNAGLHAAAMKVDCDHSTCTGACECPCVCHGWPGETTKTLAEWVTGRDAGLLWRPT